MKQILSISYALIMSTWSVFAMEWPGGDWPVDPNIQARMQRAACRDFENFTTKSRHKKGGLQTDGVVVIKEGALVYEYYEKSYSAMTPHCLWSASKTVTGTLLGAAVQAGMLDAEEPLASFYPSQERGRRSFQDDQRYRAITLSDLVSGSSGMDWKEPYDLNDPKASASTQMLYADGLWNATEYALNRPMRVEGPRGVWIYSSGNFQLMMGSLRQRVLQRGGTQNDYNKLPWNLLFRPTGMRNVVFEQDPSGVFVGSSYVHMRPRDMARLGYLFLTDGVWNGQRVLPPNWTQFAATVSPAFSSNGTVVRDLGDTGVYGSAAWWLNVPAKGLPKPYPNIPSDALIAEGHFGQVIVVLPTQKMVFVRTGNDEEYDSKLDQMIGKALTCFQ